MNSSMKTIDYVKVYATFNPFVGLDPTLTVIVKDVHKGDDETSTIVGVDLKGRIGVTRDVKPKASVLEPYQVAVIPESSSEMVTFTNKDDLFRWKFNSQAIQTHMKPEMRFILEVYGFLGYQNIHTAKAVEEAPQQE